MQKLLNTLSKYIVQIVAATGLVTIIAFSFAIYQNQVLRQNLNKIESEVTKVQTEQNELSEKLPQELFEDHLGAIENITLRGKLEIIQDELETLKNTEEGSQIESINEVYDLYASYQQKLARNNNLELNTDEATGDVDSWGTMLLNQNFDQLGTSITEKNEVLDLGYNEYLASLPPPATSAGGGYSYLNVNTEKGTFGVYLIKFPKSDVTVKTVAAIEDDCSGNCPTKSLQQYISENNAYAGMAGSYACPADYDQCSGKEWSFDFALYDSNDNDWYNEEALSWFETGMITFEGQSSNFYEETSDYGGGYVTAAVSNFPSLLNDGNIVVDEGDTDSYQEVRGLRGAIGVDNDNVYLAYITGASVIDAAYAMRAVGATDALNLDGGGTAAMYVNGGYVVGPGRPLANAVLIIK